jgi:hypothetical protein
MGITVTFGSAEMSLTMVKKRMRDEIGAIVADRKNRFRASIWGD